MRDVIDSDAPLVPDDVPDDALPVVVVGHRPPPDARVLDRGSGPPGSVFWEHQYGGLLCLQALLLGTALPLSRAPIKRADHAEVLAGLAALGLDGRLDWASAHFHELAPLHRTWGDQYGPDEIQLLADFLSRGLDLPQPVSGHEALIELAPCNLVAAFGGWPLMQQAPILTTFDAAYLDTLSEWLLRALPDAGPPRAYLVWGNSD